MEKIKNVSPEVQKAVGKYALAYKHNGAEVFINQAHRNNKYGYAMNMDVTILKDGKKLHFTMGEEIGNEQGTIFTAARIDGLPNRSSRSDNPSEGLYPYDIITKENQAEGDDLLTRAAEIYSEYEKETKGAVRMGSVFKSYVPGSYKEIIKELDGQEKSAAEKVKSAQTRRDVNAFISEYGNF